MEYSEYLGALCLLLLSFFLMSCDSGGGNQNQPPSASFSVSSEDPRAGTSVSFTASASDPDGSIESYNWEFGDGSSGSGSSVSHTYQNSGSFAVQLTVVDDEGATSTASRSLDVQQQFTEVTITRIEVREMPFTNEEGEGWDFSSGPDVYVTRFNVPEDMTVDRTSTRYDNIAPGDLPLPYSTSFTIDDLSEEQSINLIDSDPNADDFIGGVSYTFENLVGEYPNNFTLEFEDIEYNIDLEWGR